MSKHGMVVANHSCLSHPRVVILQHKGAGSAGSGHNHERCCNVRLQTHTWWSLPLHSPPPPYPGGGSNDDVIINTSSDVVVAITVSVGTSPTEVAPEVWLEVPRQVPLGVAMDTTCYARCCTLYEQGALNIVAFNFMTLGGGGGGHVLLSLLWPAGQEGQSGNIIEHKGGNCGICVTAHKGSWSRGMRDICVANM